MVHVAVADDYAPIRQALQRGFQHEPGFRWAGHADNADAAVALVRSQRVDALIFDLGMTGLGGLAALLMAAPHLRIIVYSACPASAYARRAVALGASNYLEKPADLDEIVWTVRNAMTETFPPSAGKLAPRE